MIESKPSDDCANLRKQYNSLVTLANSMEAELSILRNKDYSLAESKLHALQKSLESEIEMNSILSKEEKQLTNEILDEVERRVKGEFAKHSQELSDVLEIINSMRKE